MHQLEHLVYDLVKTNPRLKRRIRDVYQRSFDFIPVKRTASPYEITAREGYFFGFHDKSPWSYDNHYLLAHHFTIPLRMPLPDDTVEIGYFYGDNYKEFRKITSTHAWNWHQGAMLQWVGQNSHLAFNDFDGTKHIARIYDVSGKIVQTLSLPVAAVSRDGRKAASYSFARLAGDPHGYAYANGTDPEADQLIPQRDGLSIIDIDSDKSTLLFTVKQIADIDPHPSMQGAFHYFSHCQFAPSGKRLKFFHRWTEADNRLWTRMISVGVDGSDLHMFPTSGMVSHVGWQDDEHIIAYARTAEYGDHYYRFQDRTDQYEIIGEDSLTSDGHPTYDASGRWILTDTYPDRFRVRYLILFDTVQKKRYNLAKLFSPRTYMSHRFGVSWTCDLHPRWNRDNTMICVDSTHTGKRALCTLHAPALENGEPAVV